MWLHILHYTPSQVAAAMDAAAATGGFDMILMDVCMLRMGGDAACRALRAAGHSLPVLAVTANSTATDVTAYTADGFTALLPKPFTLDQLRDALLAYRVDES